MLATRETISNFIPQRAPLIMVHNLLEAGDDYAITQLQIEADNFFVSDGLFREPGLVENIAQSAAVQLGFQCAQEKVPVPMGFITAIKDLEVFSLPALNSVITTMVKITNKVFDVTLIEGKVEQEGRVVCSCEMRIFVKNNKLNF